MTWRTIGVLVSSALLGAVGAPQVTALWDEAKPYDRTLASDVALQAFDRSHPTCAMWTDWRKLCSRTGAAGASFCRIDPTRPANPSTPFCASQDLDEMSQAELASRNRFCLERGRSYRDGDDDRPTGQIICKKYGPRPFDGVQIGQMLHPACLEWGTGVRGESICSTDNRSSSALPACDSAKIRSLRTPANPLVCMRWKTPLPCKHPVGGREMAGAGDVIIYDPLVMDASPVWGTSCRN